MDFIVHMVDNLFAVESTAKTVDFDVTKVPIDFGIIFTVCDLILVLMIPSQRPKEHSPERGVGKD